MAKYINNTSAVFPPIAILGAGSWGTALALHLARLGQVVHLWSFESDHIVEMQHSRINQRYLPGYPFPDTIKPILSLGEALEDVTDILIAVPSAGFRNTLNLLKPLLSSTQRLLTATKGLDEDTGELLDKVTHQILGEHPFAVISGPSFAKEVASALPTAIVIASNNSAFSQSLAKRFNGSRFRVYLSTDVVGVELGGITKNVLAIATGISDGMGFGANARAALITRGLAEMTRLGTAMGGHAETFHGLSGLGDLILTCTDDQSRNRRFGLGIGRGESPENVEKAIGQVIEGKRNTELIIHLSQTLQIDMPIVEAVWKILQKQISPTEAMSDLFSRPMRE